ncbi:hypothetical protein V2J09_022008 [Rumex salicifolius]
MEEKEEGKAAGGRPPLSSRVPSKQVIIDCPQPPLHPAAMDDRPASPLQVLQQISEEAVRVANVAIHNVYNGGSEGGDSSLMWAAIQRSPSESPGRGYKRSNSLQNLKSQFQRALRWGASSKEESRHRNFNPEELANQKRQWYQLQSNTPDRTKYKEPIALFEHFIVTGLHSDTNLAPVEAAFAMKKKLKYEMAGAKPSVKRNMLKHSPSPPSLEPQLLFKYPQGKKLPMRSIDLCAFCFPGGVKAQLVERTPSLSDLNELVYGREHLGGDTSAFIFSLKGADATVYGVCLLVPEIVQRSPSILGGSAPLCHAQTASRFLVSAPRCYCLLTRVPFFELHYEMLNSIVAQERLNRITQFVSEMNVSNKTPLDWRSQDCPYLIGDSPDRDYMSSAIPDEAEFFLNKFEETGSPLSVAARKASSHLTKYNDKGDKISQCSDDHAYVSEQPYALERPYENTENGIISPGPSYLSCNNSLNLKRSGSAVSLLSYGALTIPARGSELAFHPLEHHQAIQYRRPAVSELGIAEEFLTQESQDPLKLAEAWSMQSWLQQKRLFVYQCGQLQQFAEFFVLIIILLAYVLALVTGVLLEKQVALNCPNLGVLSAAVLSLIPMIRPFEWQSLLLPVLPDRMLDFLEAPVPFLVGLEKKPSGVKMKTDNLVHVDLLKDQLKTCYLPLLPRRKELVAELRPIHARLACQSTLVEEPVYRCSEEQAEAAVQFLCVMKRYMESLCANLRSNTITSVQSNNDRVCILLKDSFADSFPFRDRPFIKLFVDTQMFSVLSDLQLSRFEQENV